MAVQRIRSATVPGYEKRGACILPLVVGVALLAMVGGLAGCSLLRVRAADALRAGPGEAAGVSSRLSDQVEQRTETTSRTEIRKADPGEVGGVEIRTSGQRMSLERLELGAPQRPALAPIRIGPPVDPNLGEGS